MYARWNLVRAFHVKKSKMAYVMLEIFDVFVFFLMYRHLKSLFLQVTLNFEIFATEMSQNPYFDKIAT